MINHNAESQCFYIKNYKRMDPNEDANIMQYFSKVCYIVWASDSHEIAVEGIVCDKNDDGAVPVLSMFRIMDDKQLGNADFQSDYSTKYSYYAGSMANAISSAEMVIKLGRSGFMGSYGTGGVSLEQVEKALDTIQAALPGGPYLVNLLHSPNDLEKEFRLVSLFIKKEVKAIEASAFINLSPALIYYRMTGLERMPNGDVTSNHKVIAKISREEIARKFMSPPDPKVVRDLYEKGLVTEEQVEMARQIPVADDITVEGDSGGHTDNKPLVSLLPAIISLRDELQRQYPYAKTIRVGAAGGISTSYAAAGAFQMGADYVVTGSVNQCCMEAGTSEYVKKVLTETSMSDIVMAPCADMFEMGVKVQVIKKGTMYPMIAQKLYDMYSKYQSVSEIPPKDLQIVEEKYFKKTIDDIWNEVKEFFAKADPHQIERASINEKYKMALIFRWYLGNSSKWAVKGIPERKMDMQIWCGPSMGAFNQWVKGTDLEENRSVLTVAQAIMSGCACHIFRNNIKQQACT